MTLNEHAPAVGPHQPDDVPQQHALSRTAPPEDDEATAGRHVEGHVIEDHREPNDLETCSSRTEGNASEVGDCIVERSATASIIRLPPLGR